MKRKKKTVIKEWGYRIKKENIFYRKIRLTDQKDWLPWIDLVNKILQSPLYLSSLVNNQPTNSQFVNNYIQRKSPRLRILHLWINRHILATVFPLQIAKQTLLQSSNFKVRVILYVEFFFSFLSILNCSYWSW